MIPPVRTKTTNLRRRWLAIGLGIVAIVVGIGLIGLIVLAPMIKSVVHQRAQKALEDRFESSVQVKNFEVDLFPRPKIILEGVTFQHRKYSGFPPLIELARVEADANLAGLLLHHVRQVNLVGLKIHIPKGQKDGSSSDASSGKKKEPHFPVILDTVAADDALVEIIRAAGEKPPLEFNIHQLRMQNVDLDEPPISPPNSVIQNRAVRSPPKGSSAHGRPTSRAKRRSADPTTSPMRIWGPSKESAAYWNRAENIKACCSGSK